MAASRKKLTGTIRDILHTHGVVFADLPESWRLTLIAEAETADRVKGKPKDINWAVETCWLALRDAGLAKVVDQTINYFFAGTELSVAEFQELLAVARDAEAKGLNTRAMVEEAWRGKITPKLGDG